MSSNHVRSYVQSKTATKMASLFCILIFPFALVAKQNNALQLSYVVSFENDVIGILISHRNTNVDNCKNTFGVTVTTEFEWSFQHIFSRYNTSGQEKMVSCQSQLRSFQGKYTENGAAHALSIDLNDHDYIVTFSNEGADPMEVSISNDKFDAVEETALDIFFSLDISEAALNILDFESLDIVETTYRTLGKAEYTVNNQIIECNLIGIESIHLSAQRCVTQDQTGIWVVHEKGQDSDGKYEVRLKDVVYRRLE